MLCQSSRPMSGIVPENIVTIDTITSLVVIIMNIIIVREVISVSAQLVKLLAYSISGSSG